MQCTQKKRLIFQNFSIRYRHNNCKLNIYNNIQLQSKLNLLKALEVNKTSNDKDYKQVCKKTYMHI